MTPEQAAVLTILVNVLIGGTIGVITLVVNSRSRRAEKQVETESVLTVSDRQEIYRLLADQKLIIANNTKEIDQLRDKLERTNSEVNRSNVEIVRLNAVILFYKAQLEKNNIVIAPLPSELMPRGFGQIEQPPEHKEI